MKTCCRLSKADLRLALTKQLYKYNRKDKAKMKFYKRTNKETGIQECGVTTMGIEEDKGFDLEIREIPEAEVFDYCVRYSIENQILGSKDWVQPDKVMVKDKDGMMTCVDVNHPGIVSGALSIVKEENVINEVHGTLAKSARIRGGNRKSEVSINGKVYSGANIAAAELGVNSATLSYRCRSENFDEWFYV